MISILLAIVNMALSAPAQTGSTPDDTRVYVWAVDREHSSILFETGHWGIVDIVGWFETYEMTVRSTRPDFSDAVIEARIDPASVRMPNPEMASNLRNLFFQVDEYPEILFQSTRVEPTVDADSMVLVGILTMKGVPREIPLTVRFNGYGAPPQGSPGFKLKGTLDRLDFGVGAMEFMQDTGYPLVGAEVRITCNIRLEYVRSEFE